MAKREWLEIRITLPESLQEEAGIFLTAWSGRGVVLEDEEDQSGTSRVAAIRTYFPAADFTAENRRDLLEYLDKLVSLGYRIGELQQRVIPEEDWENAWQIHFKSRRLTGRFVVRPPWEDYIPAADDVVLTIYPGMAFGTGRHPSTWLCLKAFDEVSRAWSSSVSPHVLDVGTGTGILGLAAAHLGAKVLAIDLDPEAIAAVRENIILNELQNWVRADDIPLAAIRQQFDLIFANLTAPDLFSLADSLSGRLRPSGQLIISGFLTSDLPKLQERFLGQGLTVQKAHQKDDWVALVLKRW
jgi:ribosomal protein L11 methyltransferase